MLEKLNAVNWVNYQRQSNRISFPDQIRNLISEDESLRYKAHDTLYDEIERGYEAGNDLATVLAPFFIELLGYSNVPDKGLITNLLVMITSFADDTQDVFYKALALKMKNAVCAAKDNFSSLLNDGSNLAIEEDLSYLLQICSDN